MLVNSDTAVSVAHSEFLVGLSCHMKRTNFGALSCMLAACERLVAKH